MDGLQEFLTPFSLATLGSIVLNLLLAFALGLVIAAVYRWTHVGIAEKSMTDTLIILCMLISVVMVVIGDSVARAFSLVGALSIIRFRTVVQDPRDIAFVFFALAIGMAVGAGDPVVAIVGAFLIGGIIVGLHRWHTMTSDNGEYLLTFKAPLFTEYEQVYQSLFSKQLSANRLIGQKTTKSNTVELEFHVKLKEPERWRHFVQEFSALEGITGVKLAKPKTFS
jgi:uncharacterized membrane protein YhiD involved in acid resistance